MDNQQIPDGGLRELALFAGAGGGILGGTLLGWRTVCAVEIEPYAAGVLVARQNDGCLPPFPIWDDIRTFDGRPWRGIADVVSGGFPCQDISAAGKGAGITGERSGLWKEMARIIGEVEPRFVLIENSPLLRARGLATVLKDLAEMGYDARWGVLGACDAGAPHKRDRMWIVAEMANAKGERICGERQHGDCFSHQKPERQYRGSGVCQDLAHPNGAQRERGQLPGGGHAKYTNFDTSSGWWKHDPADIPESNVGRVANGVAYRVDRLKAIGNGQVPAVVKLAWETLST